MQPLNIRYSRAMAVVALVVGVLLLAVSILSTAWLSLIAGAALTFLGILMFLNPMLRIQQGEVQVCNPIGMVIKRYQVTGPQDLVLDGKALRHVPSQKRIASLAFGVNKEDIANLRAQLGQRA